MAELRNKNIDIDNLKLEDFCPASNGMVISAFLVEGNRLILVEEVLNERVGMNFFDANTKEKISTKERYEQYNGKVINETKGNYILSSEIKVDMDTGAESVHEEVVYDDAILYSNDRNRYHKKTFKPLWERFIDETKLKDKDDLELMREVAIFRAMKFDEKIKYLRSKFRYIFKARWELGVVPEEVFLSKEEFSAFEKDEIFREVLLKVLELEESTTGKDSQIMYVNIINQCT